jgi:ribonuclease HI
MLQAWQHTRKIDAANRRKQQVKHGAWQPPPAGVVKCNIDAVIFDTKQKVGMGACLRDEERHFIAAMTANTNAVMTAAEGEAWGLYQCIKWITSFGYHKVVFELDCKMVVDDIHNKYPNHSDYGSVIQDCKR